MFNTPPINIDRVDEMAEGDNDFKSELIFAIYNSLTELKEKYLEGAEQNDQEIIQQIRHKVKPTLALFEIDRLNEIVISGKEIIEKNGFEGPFHPHMEEFLDAVQEALDHVKLYLDKQES